MADLICWNCALATGIEIKVMRSDSCPHCRSDLRCCRGCRHFDPPSRWQCRETIKGPIPHKEKSNFCDFFQMRQAFHSHRKKLDPNADKEDRKKGFDDLFKN